MHVRKYALRAARVCVCVQHNPIVANAKLLEEKGPNPMLKKFCCRQYKFHCLPSSDEENSSDKEDDENQDDDDDDDNEKEEPEAEESTPDTQSANVAHTEPEPIGEHETATEAESAVVDVEPIADTSQT